MSTRAMAQKYMNLSSGGGGRSGAPSWIRRREANEEQARQIQLIQLIHDLGLKDTQAEGEETRKTDKAKSENTINEELAKHYSMTPEDARALSPKAKKILENQMDAEIASQTGKKNPGLDTGFQSATDFGTRARAAGVNPNSLTKDIGVNSIGTFPSVPGLTAPLNTGFGIQTMRGPTEERKVTEEGGFPMEMPPGSGRYVNIGGKPAIYSDVIGGGEASFPIDPEIKRRATELNNSGVMQNTTGPSTSQLSTGTEQQVDTPKFMFGGAGMPTIPQKRELTLDDILMQLIPSLAQ